VGDENVITHRYAQQGDHTDPVAFDWSEFLRTKDNFRSLAMARQSDHLAAEAEKTWVNEWPVASTYLQIHGKLAVSREVTAATTAPSAPPAVSSIAAPEVVPPVQAKTLPALRGPIEIDPRAA